MSGIDDIKFNTSGPGTSLIEEVYGTRYPYLNTKKTLYTSTMNSIRRAIAPINPFAFSQVSSQDRVGFGIRHGSNFFEMSDYPNHIQFHTLFPSHHNPMESVDMFTKEQNKSTPSIGTYGELTRISDNMPRGCARAMDIYKRCRFINGEEKCREEGNDFLAICPNFVLDGLKERKADKLKKMGLDAFYYKKAMQVGSYNVGRSIKDVNLDVKFSDGGRNKLRPDTMYADERYTNVTQEEINAAKVRNSERAAARRGAANQAQEHHEPHGSHHSATGLYSKKHAEQSVMKEKPLYP